MDRRRFSITWMSARMDLSNRRSSVRSGRCRERWRFWNRCCRLRHVHSAAFNFADGSHEYHQETLDNLRTACANTGIQCGVLLDTKGPEIRTGMLACGGPVMLEAGNLSHLDHRYAVQGKRGKDCRVLPGFGQGR